MYVSCCMVYVMFACSLFVYMLLMLGLLSFAYACLIFAYVYVVACYIMLYACIIHIYVMFYTFYACSHKFVKCCSRYKRRMLYLELAFAILLLL